MNFNVYLDYALAQKLESLSRKQGKKRNAVIREALEAWIIQANSQTWPTTVMDYEGTSDWIAFEEYREELLAPQELEFGE